MRSRLFGLVLLAAFGGCSPNTPSVTSEKPEVQHQHPNEGPHHGTLVELGREEYHAEVTHGTDVITVYILDAQAKDQVAIDATEVTINLVHDGKPAQFQLAAAPDVNDPSGKSSRFSLTSPELATYLDDHSVTPKLNVTIQGRAYRGEIHHDHAGHDHAGHDHAH